MPNRKTSAVALMLMLAASQPASATEQRPLAVQSATLIDDAPPGETAALEAALAASHGPDAELLRARLAAMRLDGAAASRALDRYFAGRDTDPRRQSVAWTIRSTIALAEGDYAGVTEAIEKWRQLPEAARHNSDATALAQTADVARILAAAPRQAVTGGTAGTIPTARDKVGLIRAGVTVNGLAQDAVLDTGANLSVVSATTAKKLGLRPLDGEATVGSTSSTHVPTRLAIADRLTIAGVAFANVVFLVMDDSQLSFPVPGGYTIDAIIGFPLFRALGRVRFDRAGGFAAGAAAGPSEALDNLRADGNDLFVKTRANGVDVALHLDTGAARTSLSSRFAELHKAMLKGLPTSGQQISGAGGKSVTQTAALLRPATIELAGRSLKLPELRIIADAGGTNEKKLGVIGQDVLSAFQSYTIDFATMSFVLGDPAS